MTLFEPLNGMCLLHVRLHGHLQRQLDPRQVWMKELSQSSCEITNAEKHCCRSERLKDLKGKEKKVNKQKLRAE